MKKFADGDVTRAAAALDQIRVRLICQREQLGARLQNAAMTKPQRVNGLGQLGGFIRGSAYVLKHHLHLADQNRLVRVHMKTARRADNFGGITARGDDGRLFRHHWNQIIAFVYGKVRRNTQRQTIESNDILDQLVCLSEFQTTAQ